MSTAESESVPIRRRPGGRTGAHTAAIMAATLELMGERGHSAVTFAEVAERAGVSRATMYRRWPSVPALLSDAIAHGVEGRVVVPDTGALRSDLIELLQLVSSWIESPVGRAGLAVGLDREPASSRQAAWWRARVMQIARIIERAQDRGELPAELDTEVAIAMVSGPVYFRLLVMGAPADADWIERIVDAFLDGFTR